VTELEEAIIVLDDLRRQDPCIQRSRNRELIGSFSVFWQSAPSIDVFTKQTDGLLFTNRMLYFMIENPIWRSHKPPAAISAPAPIAPVPAEQQDKRSKHK